jgi:hypothetical protein
MVVQVGVVVDTLEPVVLAQQVRDMMVAMV